MKLFALLSVFTLSGCFMTFPLGESGKYGSVRVDVNYAPPVNLWQTAPTFLADK